MNCPGTELLTRAVDESVVREWLEVAEHPQHKEILRLALIGLWAERHETTIKDSLQLALGELSVAVISRFERALDSLKRLKQSAGRQQ